MNALIYLRVSTDKQAEKGLSVPAQREACLEYAKRNDYEIIGEYKDEGESAKTMDRPALLDMLEYCKKDKTIGAIIVYDVSRLARNRYDYALIKKELEKNKIKLCSVTEPIDDTPEGQLVDGIMSAFAEFRSRQDARKIKMGMFQKVQEGWLPVRAPFGYKNVQEKGGLGRKDKRWIETDEKEVHWVQRAFMLYGTGKYTLRELADLLNTEGFPTRNGKPLQASSLEGILKNKFYIGVIEWGGATNPNGKHTPIIEPALFDKVQAIFSARNEGVNRQRKHWFLLRGLAFCGECGSRITGEDHPKKGKRYYRCQKTQKNKKVECHQRMIPESDLDNQFAELFKMVQLPDGFVEKLRNKIRTIFEKENAIYEKSRKSLLSQIENMRNRQKILLEKLLDGTINDELYETTTKEMQEKEKELKNQLSKVEYNLSGIMRTLEIALFLANNCYKGFLKASPDLRKLLVQAFFKEILVKDKKIAQARLNEPLGYLCKNKLKSNPLFKLEVVGGPRGTRTLDLLNADQMLYQLNYGPFLPLIGIAPISQA